MKSFNYLITIKIIQEKEAKEAPFVAYIPEFDISSCGKTEEEAIKNVREALKLTLEEIKRKGKLKEFLQETGIPLPPKKTSLFPKIIIHPFSFNL